MSMSDTFLCALREMHQYGIEEYGVRDIADRMARYVVEASDPVMHTEKAIQRAIQVLDRHIEDTLEDWSDTVNNRLDDFNVCVAALRDVAYKPEYEAK